MDNTAKLCLKCSQPLPPEAVDSWCSGCKSAGAVSTTKIVGQAAPCPPSPAALAPHFPQLEIIELLGQGGMGMVYKARQPKLDRFVALKILPANIENDSNFAERFAREAKIMARLNHPNIVAIYDFGKSGDYYFFLMEFVDGANLRQLETAHQLTPSEALKIVPALCDALEYAHSEGVVHRDIKPANILIDRKGRVKIADFGLGKLLGKEAQDFDLTGSRDVMGTLHYMAPEQYDNPLGVDSRADIFSLGVVFYEMLTGELPLGRFGPPSAKVQVDVRLDEVVLKSLERDPKRRYQHASELKTSVESLGTKPEPVVRNSRTGLVVAVAVSVLALALAGWWLASQPHKSVSPAAVKAGASSVPVAPASEMAAGQQLTRVMAKLKELNPGFDGQEKHKITDGEVVELHISTVAVTDISPVRELKQLQQLSCWGRPMSDPQAKPSGRLADISSLQGLSLNSLILWGNPVKDLSPLQGMPLEFLGLDNTDVSDLTPLKGMPLRTLFAGAYNLKDFSPLIGLPLHSISFRGDQKPDLTVLRSIKTLEKIMGKPAAQFWKQSDASQARSSKN